MQTDSGVRGAGVAAKERLGSLYAVSFLANFDRIVILPLLVPAAQSLHADLGAVTLALTAYLLLFGVMQPVYGIVSDLVGRVRVIRMALLGLCGADLLAAFAPNVGLLIAGRALAGASAAALLPVVFAYVGDRVPFERRQRTIANVLSVAAVGVAVATVVAGVLTHLINWRAPVALAALAAPVIAILVGRRPEAFSRQADRPRLPARFAQVFGRGWFQFLVGLALVEGAAMQGFFNFFAPALQAQGNGVVVTGLVTASYGVAVIAGGVIVRASGRRASAATLFGVGGALLCGGYLIAAQAQTIATILAASVLAGLAYALVQSTVQTWATEVASPAVRGLATSLVACAVFTGAAVGSAAVGGLAAHRDFTGLFLIAAAVTVPVAVAGAIGRARFEPARHRTPAPVNSIAGTSRGPATVNSVVRPPGSHNGRPPVRAEPERPAGPAVRMPTPLVDETAPPDADVEHRSLILGHVADSTTSPLAGATVTLTDLAGRILDRGSTDSGGNYRLHAPAGGSHLVICTPAGHVPTAALVSVDTEPTRHDFRLTDAGASLSGTVTSADTGGPITGAVVSLIDARGDVAGTTTTSTEGSFTFVELLPGHHTLTVAATSAPSVTHNLEVPVHGHVIQDVRMAARVRLAGTVRTTNTHAPVPEALTTLVTSEGHIVASAVTDNRGRFAFDDVNAGRYTIVASGYPPVAVKVQLRGRGPTRTVISLQPPKATDLAPGSRIVSNTERNDGTDGT